MNGRIRTVNARAVQNSERGCSRVSVPVHFFQLLPQLIEKGIAPKDHVAGAVFEGDADGVHLAGMAPTPHHSQSATTHKSQLWSLTTRITVQPWGKLGQPRNATCQPTSKRGDVHSACRLRPAAARL